MINDVPRYKLKEIIAKYPDMYKEPKRCKSMLNDYCPEYKKEINALISVMEEGGVNELLRYKGQLNYAALETKCFTFLSDKTALDKDFLIWAIQSWALALYILTEAELQNYKAEKSQKTVQEKASAETSNTYEKSDRPNIHQQAASTENTTASQQTAYTQKTATSSQTANSQNNINRPKTNTNTVHIQQTAAPKVTNKKTKDSPVTNLFFAFVIISVVIGIGSHIYDNYIKPSKDTASIQTSQQNPVSTNGGTETQDNSSTPSPASSNQSVISNLGIKVIQNDSMHDITEHTQQVKINKDKFTIRFNLKPYDSANNKLYAARFAAVPTEESFNLVDSNVSLSNIPLFPGGAALATSGPYGGIAVSDVFFHYVIYDETDKDAQRAVLVENNNGILTLDYDISNISLNDQFYDVKDLPVDNLYIIVFIDNDLDEIIDDDEYAKIKIVF